MSDGSQLLRRIAWRDLCPWLIIFRSFRLSISLPVLFLATVGTVLTPAGWMLSRLLFLGETNEATEFSLMVDANAQWPDRVGMYRPDLFGAGQPDQQKLVAALHSVPSAYLRFVEPWAQLAKRPLSISFSAYLLFGAIWNVAVWSLLAGSITRLAAIRLGREEQLSLRQAVGHALKNYLWYFAAPFLPLLGIAIVAAPIALLGLVMRISVAAIVAALLWPLVLMAGVLMAAMLVGALFGWPLMWPTISCEESSDAFEAFSRSFSFTFQRPLHYLFFAFVTVVFGGLCWLFVSEFAAGVVRLTEWAASSGAGSARWEQLMGTENTGVDWMAGGLLQFFNGAVTTVATAFNYSFFFCASTAVYLLLRREVDQTEFDEIFSEDDEQRYDLPDIRAASPPSQSPPSADDAEQDSEE